MVWTVPSKCLGYREPHDPDYTETEGSWKACLGIAVYANAFGAEPDSSPKFTGLENLSNQSELVTRDYFGSETPETLSCTLAAPTQCPTGTGRKFSPPSPGQLQGQCIVHRLLFHSHLYRNSTSDRAKLRLGSKTVSLRYAFSNEHWLENVWHLCSKHLSSLLTPSYFPTASSWSSKFSVKVMSWKGRLRANFLVC